MMKDCLHHIIILLWPAQSPDLSLIEHVWDYLGQQVGQPANLVELEAH